MIKPEDLHRALSSQGIDFFAGVPDSLLKDFLAYLAEHTTAGTNVIAANEGGAIGLVVGHYLATKKPGFVYLQNSGLGNTVNPLLSLADPEIYGIPMLLMIGWRGEPGTKDEPQHRKQGRITRALLDAMEIPNRVIDANTQDVQGIVEEALRVSKQKGVPFALVVRKGTFEPYNAKVVPQPDMVINREEAIKVILETLGDHDIVVSTTGMTSREVFEIRGAAGQNHAQDFLTVGSMGHASQIALGIALAKPARRVLCLDGDGAAIMHLGSLTIIGTVGPTNLTHIILNNGAHDSVGGQPTAAFGIQFTKIAESCGYRSALSVATLEELRDAIEGMRRVAGPLFLEVKVKKGARKNLGRPTTTPEQNKMSFMEFLQG
jgi:phosphonopyruvate decarboxylase